MIIYVKINRSLIRGYNIDQLSTENVYPLAMLPEGSSEINKSKSNERS
jgi:hypothetical protein